MGKNKAVKPTLVMKEDTEELLLVSRNSGRFRRIRKSPLQGSRKARKNT